MIRVIGQLTDQLREMKALIPDGLSNTISSVFLKGTTLPVSFLSGGYPTAGILSMMTCPPGIDPFVA